MIIRGKPRYAIPPMVIAVALFVGMTQSEAFTTWAEGMRHNEWDPNAELMGFPTTVFLYAFAISAWIAAMIDCQIPTSDSEPLWVSRMRKHVTQFQLLASVGIALFALSESREKVITQQQYVMGMALVGVAVLWAFLPRKKPT
jgi:hypothetical protein